MTGERCPNLKATTGAPGRTGYSRASWREAEQQAAVCAAGEPHDPLRSWCSCLWRAYPGLAAAIFVRLPGGKTTTTHARSTMPHELGCIVVAIHAKAPRQSGCSSCSGSSSGCWRQRAMGVILGLSAGQWALIRFGAR